MIFDSALIQEPGLREDVNYLKIAMNDIAKEIGNQKVINMIALGGWATVTDYLSLGNLKDRMPLMLEESGKGKFVDINEKALEEG